MKHPFLLALALALLACPAWSATVTHEIDTADTGVGPNTSGSFTPAADDLLIVYVVVSDTADTGCALTSSVGTTFTKIQQATYRTSLDLVYAFVANALSTATAQTVTMTCGADNFTGSVIMVEAVAGMSRTGSTAILQSTRQQNQASGGTPAPVFAANVLTDNATIGCVGNSTNPAGLTAPTDWTEAADTGYATPTTGFECVFRNSGFTGTTVTWGSTSASAFGDLIVELDTSVPATGCGTTIALTGAGCP